MKKRKIIIIIIASVVGVIVIGLLGKVLLGLLFGSVDARVNELVDKRLSEFYFEPNSSMSGNQSTNSSDYSKPEDSFTSTSWSDNSDTSAPAPEKTITAQISNTEAANSTKVYRNLPIYGDYDTAFNSMEELPSGRYVTILLDTNLEVEITGKVSFFNPDSDEFETEDFSFESAVNSTNDQIRLKFKIPENPYIEQCWTGTIEVVVVFTVVTADGNYYLTCAY